MVSPENLPYPPLQKGGTVRLVCDPFSKGELGGIFLNQRLKGLGMVELERVFYLWGVILNQKTLFAHFLDFR